MGKSLGVTRKLLGGSALVLAFLAVLVSNVLSLSYTIVVNYPSSAYLGQEITISFQLLSNYINSTNFPIISSGVEIIHNGSEVEYTEATSYAGYLLFPVNITRNVTELIVTFVGEYHTYYYADPGIILYGGNFRPPLPDAYQNNFTTVVLTFNGRFLLHINGSWISPPVQIPYYGSFVNGWINVSKPVNYTVIFEEDKGFTLVKYLFINNEGYIINYLVPVPWNFSYVGIRIPPNILIIPKEYCVGSPVVNQYYTIYLNGKEYASGYTNAEGQGYVSFRVTSIHEVVNITWPAMHLYKVIVISGSNEGNVKVGYPILPLSLLGTSITLTGIALIASLRRK